MKTLTETTIRTRKDGSIDMDYYLNRGHECRSEQAHLMGRSLAKTITASARFVFQMPERLSKSDRGASAATHVPAE